MDKGTVLFHTKFQFSDGETGRKLIIILNTPRKNEPYLICRTTSNPQYNINTQGCRSDKNIYYINANFDCFLEKTWIQFYEIFEFNNGNFLNDHLKGNLKIIGCLKSTTIQAIINCIKRSEDISNYHLSLLK